MSNQPRILCSCGRQIRGREVLQQGHFMSQWKPMSVYVKFRCSRCRMLGERLVDYARWEEGILSQETDDVAAVDGAPVVATGVIEDAEVERFAETISTLRASDIEQLANTLKQDGT